MNSKKAITLLVLATLVMALVPSVPVNAVIATTNIDWKNPATGTWVVDYAGHIKYNEDVKIKGTGVTAGAAVNVYWDNAMKETYSEGSGKVASGTAKSDGGFSIAFKVPEAIYGSHYIWVKDVSTSQTASFLVTVDPKVTVSPSSGLVGDKITVNGYGFTFDEDFDTPVTLTVGGVYGATFVFTPAAPNTNSLGSVSATFIVPNVPKGVYTISGDDPVVAPATVDFEHGASIILSVDVGPVGTVVTITGRGFWGAPFADTVTVTLSGTTCYIVSGATVRSDGRITTRVVIPNKAVGEYVITVADLHSNAPTADFEVDGVASVKATPAYGVQGTQVTVNGYNFTRISGTEVIVNLAGSGEKTYKTDASGHFSGTFQIPAVGSGTQTLSAATATHFISDTSSIRVGIMLVIATPNTGPSGALVSVTGVGFIGDTGTGSPITVNIGDDEWFTTSTAGDGLISESVNVPSLEPGTYTVTVIEDNTEIEVTATLTVTEKTMIELSPTMAPNSYRVEIEGFYFAEAPSIPTLEFVLYNSTQEWILDVTYKDDDVTNQTVVLDLDDDWDPGYFSGVFKVPVEDTIGIGAYTLNVTDGMGMYAQAAFQVVPKTTTITPRKSTFRIGETVAFNVESSFSQSNAYIRIKDPSGAQYWRTDPFDAAKWTKIGDLMVYPFYQQTAGGNPMALLEDAPLGVYTWGWYASDGDLLDEGTFTVAAAAEEVLGQQIQDLNEAVTDLTSDISTVSSEVAQVRTQITNAINAANAAVQAANAATQAVNAVAQTANAASTAATNAANAATEAKNAANGLTTLVYGAIGASLVAALAAIVSLMQISRRIAG